MSAWRRPGSLRTRRCGFERPVSDSVCRTLGARASVDCMVYGGFSDALSEAWVCWARLAPSYRCEPHVNLVHCIQSRRGGAPTPSSFPSVGAATKVAAGRGTGAPQSAPRALSSSVSRKFRAPAPRALAKQATRQLERPVSRVLSRATSRLTGSSASNGSKCAAALASMVLLSVVAAYDPAAVRRKLHPPWQKRCACAFVWLEWSARAAVSGPRLY